MSARPAIAAGLVALVFCLFHPLVLSADPSGDPAYGVLALDRDAQSRRAASRAADLVDGRVISGNDRLARRTGERRIAAGPDLQHRADRLTSRVERAVEVFFERGADGALSELERVYEQGVQARALRVHRPAAARATLRAGIYIVRAHLDLDDGSAARTWARRVSRRFPTATFPRRRVPPAARNLLQSERKELYGGEETVRRSIERAEGCRAAIAGLPADTEVVRLISGREYGVSLSCDGEVVSAWRFRASDGSAPIPLYRFEGPFEGANWRRAASRSMRARVFWSDIEGMIGVLETDGTLRVGAFVGAEEVRWTALEGASPEAVERALVRVAPSVAPSVSREEAPGGRGSRARWVAPVLVAGGAVSAGGSAAYLATAVRRRSLEIRCSPDTSGTSPSASVCSGVATVVFDQGNLSRARRRLRAARIGAWSGLALGMGALTWGIVRFAGGGRSGAPVSIRPSLGSGRVGVDVVVHGKRARVPRRR
ncbi:MAG: hypothetical protein ABEL76_02405 [Bradymonadaceae bacterium]